ncbi:MAG: competence/damage-inducible protein A [Bacteroidetes bacterium]|nr:competence/damage-inducible protein A [Bacteroidota bacterium]
MKAALLIIGDEILNGTTLDTNSQYLARQLEGLNIKVVERNTISDKKEAIIKGLDHCLANADLVVTTGGLGPTKDDITKKTIAEYFGVELVMNHDVLAQVESFFAKKNRPILEVNRLQALVPENCMVLQNKMGTAPGMLIEHNGKILVSMPGVPHEMQYITENGLLPYLEILNNGQEIIHHHLHTIGVGESRIAQQLEAIEDSMPAHIGLAYLPSPGMVKLRLTGVSEGENNTKSQIAGLANSIKQTLGTIVFGEGNTSISQVIGEQLLKTGKTLSTAESCSSGYLAQLITQTPGSSQYYEGSIVAYSYRLKKELLGVKHDTLTEHGAVSEETIIEMVEGGRKKLGTDYAIATSGIAGPGGGMPNKPVGTVWIAVASQNQTITKKWQFGSDRARNTHLTAIMGLEMLRRLLLNLPQF